MIHQKLTITKTTMIPTTEIYPRDSLVDMRVWTKTLSDGLLFVHSDTHDALLICYLL